MEKKKSKGQPWTDNGYCRSSLLEQWKECKRECRFAEAYRKGFTEASDMAIKWIEDNVMDYCDIYSYNDFMRAFAKAMRKGGGDGKA